MRAVCKIRTYGPLHKIEDFVAREWIRKFGRSHGGGVYSWSVRIEKFRRHDVVKAFSPWTSLGGMIWETAPCLLVDLNST